MLSFIYMADTTYFFYDLETSGLDPRRHRIMQFAGQRTDMNLQPIGEPVNLLVQLTDEILPSPDSVLITGITPQQTVRDGITEAELARFLQAEVFTPGTIATGFNNIRFDDNFIRFLFYRNFFDPYDWAYADGRSRWDLLDVVRMTRALRPDGINWPVDETGRAVNKLALLSEANGLEHVKAHDALSDVQALIAVAQLIRERQPKLYHYLLALRSKHEVAKVVDPANPQPFVYTSGRFPAAHQFTTIGYPIGLGRHNAIIVYDLRHHPDHYADISIEELAASRFANAEQRQAPGYKPFPAKELTVNNCPAVSPLSPLDADSQTRILLDPTTAQLHLEALQKSDLLLKIREIMGEHREFDPHPDVDGQLYDGFINGADKYESAIVRQATASELAQLQPRFKDLRLPELFIRYKARNFPGTLRDSEQTAWENYRHQRLSADLPVFAEELQRASLTADTAGLELLTDLKLWAESIAPA